MIAFLMKTMMNLFLLLKISMNFHVFKIYEVNRSFSNELIYILGIY
jgi:hypothetical protein